jgi:hypothetical protein
VPASPPPTGRIFIFNKNLNALCFLRGRIAFLDAQVKPQPNNPYDSALYGYNVDPQRFHSSFKGLGKVLLVQEAHE